MFNNKVIMLTGGTGSFGNKFVELVLKKFNPKKLIIYSRDEYKQFLMQKKFDPEKYPALRFFLGDVRDLDRLKIAMRNVDFVVHAAALKHVPAAEYNPIEFVKTNIYGAENVVQSAISQKVSKVIALSTDKAASPINLYGATKLCSDKMFIAAKNYAGTNKIKFSIVRYGNVMESRGSVIPLFKKQMKTKVLNITDTRMTRFTITLEEGVNMVFWVLKNSIGGEIFVPKIPSFKILDLAKIISPNSKIKIIGVRKGEKIDEELITKSDSMMTYDLGKYYAIIADESKENLKFFKKKFKKFKKIKNSFSYNSKDNKDLLKGETLRKYLKKYSII